MFRSTLLSSLVLFLAGTTQALKVPLDLAPGVYSIPFDNNGVAAGDPVLLGPISARVRRALEARQQSPPRLQLPQARCQSSGTIVVADFDAAKADFQAYCDMGVANAAQTAVVYTIGNMIAYMCNYNSPNRCWREEYEQAIGTVVAMCGLYKGGEVYVQNYDKSYGGNSAGQEICLH